MFERTRKFLGGLGRTEPPDLQLLHGASLLNDSYARIRTAGIAEDPDETVWARSWFTSTKRALLSEYGVGTIDQALHGVLNIKHQPLRLWGLGNRTIVIDEVHAYDLYTSKLVERLVAWLKELGSTVILLSATLPRAKRNDLIRAYGGSAPREEARYPRITIVCGGDVASRAFTAPAGHQVSIHPVPLGVQDLALLGRDLVRTGGCLGVVMNTVQRAQGLYLALGEGRPIEGGKRLLDGTEVYLFHARFPADERLARERLVIEKFGKNGSRPHKAILVATQVVEQSLDLDFDVLITDLAPIDLILQRIGRLHRHDNERPVRHLTPAVHIAGLTGPHELPDLKSPYFDVIYEPYTLLWTWKVLASRTSIAVPGDLERLIEQVYQDHPTEEFPPEHTADFAQAWTSLAMTRNMQQQRAVSPLTVVGLPVDYVDANPGAPTVLLEDADDPRLHQDFRPTTRLGRPSIVVIPLFAHRNRVFLDREHTVAVDLDAPPDWSLAKKLLARHLKLSRPGIVRSIVGTQYAPGWKRDRLLRFAYPLILIDGEASFAGVTLRLDEELGLTYASGA